MNKGSLPEGAQLTEQLTTRLFMDASDFEARWAAD